MVDILHRSRAFAGREEGILNIVVVIQADTAQRRFFPITYCFPITSLFLFAFGCYMDRHLRFSLSRVHYLVYLILHGTNPNIP